jgi:hypothetical protein
MDSSERYGNLKIELFGRVLDADRNNCCTNDGVNIENN